MVRKQTEEKARLLYRFLDSSEGYEPFVREERHRSQTVVVARTKRPSAEVIAAVKEAGMVVGSGYGKFKESQIRIANFPATSAEQLGRLVDHLRAVQGK